MSEKKGFTTSPMGGPGAGGFVPGPPPHHAAAAAAAAAAYAGGGASPYAAAAYQNLYQQGQAQQQNAAQAAYDQQQAILAAAAAAQHMYPAAAVGGAVYPQAYSTYPSAFTPVQAYYPLTAAAYSAYHPQMRPTVVIPAGYDGGARFDGIAAPVIPGPPPGIPPTPAQLAAMAGHNVALTKKQGNFLTGASDGGYTFW